MFAHGKQLSVPKSYKHWLAWFLFALVTIPWANSAEIAAFKALSLVQIVPVAFVLTTLLVWNGTTRFFRIAIVGTALIASGMVWIDPRPFTGIDGRVFGPLGNANSFGGMLVVAVIFLFAAIAGSKNTLLRLLYLGGVGALVYMILQTGSRQALAGILIAGLVTLLAYLSRSGRLKLMPLLVAVVILTLSAPIAFSLVSKSEFWFRTVTALNTLETGNISEADNSLIGRVWLYGRALDVALANPMFGVGLDNFRTAHGAEIGRNVGTYSHSNYMEILTGTGLPGFLMYFSIYVLWLQALYANRRLIARPEMFSRYTSLITVVVTFMAMDFTSVSYYDKFDWLIFAWLIAEFELLRREQLRAMSRQRVEAATDLTTPSLPVTRIQI